MTKPSAPSGASAPDPAPLAPVTTDSSSLSASGLPAEESLSLSASGLPAEESLSLSASGLPASSHDPLDHDGDGRRGGSLPRDLGRSVHGEAWVVLLADGERGPRGAVRRVSGAAAAELAGAGLARPATDRDLGIAGIDRPDA